MTTEPTKDLIARILMRVPELVKAMGFRKLGADIQELCTRLEKAESLLALQSKVIEAGDAMRGNGVCGCWHDNEGVQMQTCVHCRYSKARAELQEAGE